MTPARNGAAPAALARAYQVQVRGRARDGWRYAHELGNCPLFRSRRDDESVSIFDSALDAEDARVWLIEERDYPPEEVRIVQHYQDDE